MKTNLLKSLVAVGLMLAALMFATPATAQNAIGGPVMKSYSLLGDGVYAIWVTNTVGVTNLSVNLSTNNVGILFSNLTTSGFVRRATSAQAYTNLNLLGNVPFPVRQDGQAWGPPTNTLTTAFLSPASISVTMSGGSAANTAIPFVIKPSWDGIRPDTSTTYDWTFAITPTASATISTATNVPLWQFNGAKKLFLARVTNTDADASGHVIITDVSLNAPFTP